MKKRILNLCHIEAVRYQEEMKLTVDYLPTIFKRLVDNYYNTPKKKRGKLRLALEEVNSIKPIRGVYAYNG